MYKFKYEICDKCDEDLVICPVCHGKNCCCDDNVEDNKTMCEYCELAKQFRIAMNWLELFANNKEACCAVNGPELDVTLGLSNFLKESRE